jgi:23S rRNA pseudouridine1911/1915/1917 synthase
VNVSLPLRVQIEPDEAGTRLDGVLRPRLPGYSRAAVHELFAEGRVRVNGRRARKGDSAEAGSVVEVLSAVAEAVPQAGHAGHTAPALPSVQPGAQREPPELHVLYEDAELVVVDKPAHLPSHALRPFETRALAQQLLTRYPEMAGVGHSPLEPGLVHRLDTETSGVVLAARTPAAFEQLKRAHAERRIEKRYVALCAGTLERTGPVKAELAADRRKVRVQAQPFAGSKPVSLTILRSQPVGGGAFSLVTVEASFAARHQVRAQLAALGHPIVADALYGGPMLPPLDRHFLHASELRLHTPSTGDALHVVAELPAELQAVLAAMA